MYGSGWKDCESALYDFDHHDGSPTGLVGGVPFETHLDNQFEEANQFKGARSPFVGEG